MRYVDSWKVSKGKGLALCCAVTLGKVADIAIRNYSGRLVDNCIGRGEFMEALPRIIMICGASLLLQYLAAYAGDRFEASYTGTLFSRLEDKILYAEQEQIDKRSIGEFSTCLSSDIFGILQYVRRMLLVFFPDMISFAVCIFLIVSMKPALGLAALASGMLSVFLMTRLSRSMVKSLNDYQDKLKGINGLTSDGLFNLEMVKVNGMEKGLAKQYADELGQLHRIKKITALRQAFLSAPTMTLSFMTLISIALCGVYFVSLDQISVGQLLSAITLSDYIVSPIMRFENTLVQHRRAGVNLRNFSLFEEMEQEKEAVSGVKAASECKIKELSFHYPDGKKIFDGFSLQPAKGTINYIVGNNGFGKSTLMKIIGGVYGADGGEILLPVKSNDRRSIREAVSIMSQEAVIFADSVRANLLAGTSGAEEKMRRMCASLDLDEEILNMEDGTVLSGGQKKRLGFVRSMLHEAEVYIFDEPTAGVDRENSVRMMEYITELAKRRYVIMITHDREMMDKYPGNVYDIGEAQGAGEKTDVFSRRKECRGTGRAQDEK